MDINNITKIMDDYLQEVSDHGEKLKRINELFSFLNFESQPLFPLLLRRILIGQQSFDFNEKLISIDDYLQEVSDHGERIKRINELFSFLNFHKLLENLSPEERNDFEFCNQKTISIDDQKKILNQCKTQDARIYYENFWSKIYRQRRDWVDYLLGKIEEKPIIMA